MPHTVGSNAILDFSFDLLQRDCLGFLDSSGYREELSLCLFNSNKSSQVLPFELLKKAQWGRDSLPYWEMRWARSLQTILKPQRFRICGHSSQYQESIVAQPWDDRFNGIEIHWLHGVLMWIICLLSRVSGQCPVFWHAGLAVSRSPRCWSVWVGSAI